MKYGKEIAMIIAALVVQALALHAMGQSWISSSGKVMLWVGDITSSELSQQIADWYTFSHIIHGFIFCIALKWLFPRLSMMWMMVIALGVEIAWELVENSPPVIEHYRQQALAAGYYGDSILNSVCDTLAMVGGLVFAQMVRPIYVVIIMLVFELGTLYMVRDNLTLNVINLIYPIPAIHQWQSEILK